MFNIPANPIGNHLFIRLHLSNLANAGLDVTLANSQGVGTITNNDAATISISDVSLDEGDSGTTTFSFSVSLDAEIDIPMTIDFVTTDASATVNDYTAVASSVATFAANTGGAQVQQIVIQVTGDSRVELNEGFLVTLSNLVTTGRDVIVTDAPAVGTIRNDDVATLSIADVTVNELDSGAATVTFTVTLDAEVDSDIAVDYDTLNNTATTTSGDYVATNGNSFTFAANSGGSQSQTFTVSVNGDETVELDETFFANLSGLVTNGRSVVFGQAQALATITNDDVATIVITDVTRDEGDAGTTVFGLNVTLSGEIDVPVSLEFSTVAGTATAAGGDYTAVSGQTLTFAARNGTGTQQLVAPIAVTGDQNLELDESFFVDLANLQAAGRAVTIVDSRGVAVVTNDDIAAIAVDDASIEEGDSGIRNLVFTVTLNAEVDSDVTVAYVVEGVTATADVDFQTVPGGTLTFVGGAGVGAMTQTITVPIIGDNIVELNETLRVTLSSITDGGEGVTLADRNGIGTIENDDAALISISNVSVSEGDGTGNTMTFTVSVDNDVDSPFTVTYNAINGTAIRNSDYSIADPSDLQFDGTKGQSHTITVQTLPDSIVELDETFFIDLVSQNATSDSVTFATTRGTGTIQNDDSATPPLMARPQLPMAIMFRTPARSRSWQVAV